MISGTCHFSQAAILSRRRLVAMERDAAKPKLKKTSGVDVGALRVIGSNVV